MKVMSQTSSSPVYGQTSNFQVNDIKSNSSNSNQWIQNTSVNWLKILFFVSRLHLHLRIHLLFLSEGMRLIYILAYMHAQKIAISNARKGKLCISSSFSSCTWLVEMFQLNISHFGEFSSNLYVHYTTTKLKRCMVCLLIMMKIWKHTKHTLYSDSDWMQCNETNWN